MGVHSILAIREPYHPAPPPVWNDLSILHAVQREWCPNPEIGRYCDVRSLREGHKIMTSLICTAKSRT